MSMGLTLHLAMTAAELAGVTNPPTGCGWMACHFSGYGTGLSNCPETLPEHSVLILNDRTPPCGHDPKRIALQLKELTEHLIPDCVLLDLQRQDAPENAEIAKAVTEALTCPVGVSALYAKNLDCPVFLPPLPHHHALATHLAPWDGREIWLEIAMDCEEITVTPEGSRLVTLPHFQESLTGFEEPNLHCHYRIETAGQQAVFTLWRTQEDLRKLLEDAGKAGITKAFGLYQELSGFDIKKEVC